MSDPNAVEEALDAAVDAFKEVTRRIPRPTVGGVEADTNPSFYACLCLY